MRINAFFANRLNAPLYNHNWSWGAVDSNANRVFLRAGEQDVYEDNGDWLLVFNPNWNKSSGRKERQQHIELIREGSEGYAVLVRYSDNYKISSFDNQSLYRLGRVVDEEELTYAEIVDQVDIDAVVSGHRSGSVVEDISELIRGRKKETTRLAEVAARLGQGEFRNAVLRKWDYQCCVTGISTAQAIRASHIKPWIASTDDERLDPHNGLPLIATLDALFDAGLISFSDDGALLVSNSMNEDDIATLQLTGLALSHSIPPKTKRYLNHHRETHGFLLSD